MKKHAIFECDGLRVRKITGAPRNEMFEVVSEPYEDKRRSGPGLCKLSAIEAKNLADAIYDALNIPATGVQTTKIFYQI